MDPDPDWEGFIKKIVYKELNVLKHYFKDIFQHLKWNRENEFHISRIRIQIGAKFWICIQIYRYYIWIQHTASKQKQAGGERKSMHAKCHVLIA